MEDRTRLPLMLGMVIFTGALLATIAIVTSARSNWENRYPVAAGSHPPFFRANN